jgi:hypothetical protein
MTFPAWTKKNRFFTPKKSGISPEKSEKQRLNPAKSCTVKILGVVFFDH